MAYRRATVDITEVFKIVSDIYDTNILYREYSRKKRSTIHIIKRETIYTRTNVYILLLPE